MIHIENIENKKVMGVTNDGKAIEEKFVQNNPRQIWKKRRVNEEGYFILEHSETQKVMTVVEISSTRGSLEIKGNSKAAFTILFLFFNFFGFIHFR